MEDYASAALVGFVRTACTRRGLALAAPPAIGQGAKIGLETKRMVLRRIADAHGLATVYEIGRDIRGAPFDPIVHMLLGAATGLELVERWQRMERYVHSRHRLRLERHGARDLTLAHVSELGEPPEAAEDLLVAGLLAGLLERRGCAGVALRLLRDESGELDPGHVESSAQPLATNRWRLTWRAEPPRDAAARPAPLGASQAIPRGLTARVLSRLAEDPTRSWSLRVLADELGLSPRTLQRRLADDGTSLSRSIADARVREAARLLAETQTPIGLVGLLSGYADPPHFSREFRKRTGLGPKEYRALESAAAAGGEPPDGRTRSPVHLARPAVTPSRR